MNLFPNPEKLIKGWMYRVFQKALFSCKPHKKKSAREIHLIYKPDAIGDFLLAGGVIRQLIKRAPGPWGLICSPQVKDLAEHLFPDLILIVLQGSNRGNSSNAFAKICSLRCFCRSHRVGTLVCLRHSLTGMDHVLLNWLHPEISSGIHDTPMPAPTPDRYRTYRFNHAPVYPTERGQLPLEVHAHLAVVNALIDSPLLESDCMPFLNLQVIKRNAPPELAVFPVTRSRLRNYPLPKLSETVNQFLRVRPDFRVTVFGTRDDEADLRKFQSLLQSPHPVNIEYPASILDAAKRIQQSTQLLCMESAPAHIATILDIPMVCILGGGHYDYFAPWFTSSNQHWIAERLPCYSCNWNCVFDTSQCIDKITSASILNGLLQQPI
ncbi:MAG: hypothetical protein JJU05_08550 [Verrucomicrobia bacterium]|nr:hypothetical protein [Verrucomicrobiota bacterium]MCH8527344.1 hypothetical protein [Kiritimatiellia bacterium]